MRRFREGLDDEAASAWADLSAALADVADDPQALHRARVAIKRLRSRLRMVGGGIPLRQRRHLEAGWRCLATLLAPAREAAAHLAAWDAGGGEGGPFRRVLEERARAARWRLRGLRHLLGRLAAWTRSMETLATPTRRQAWAAFRQAYRRACRSFLRSARWATVARVHAWRKRIKDVAFQGALLAPVAGRALRRRVRRWQALAAIIGEARDAHLLAVSIAGDPAVSTAHRPVLAARFRARARRLCRRALRLGKSAFSAPSRRLVAAIR